MAKRRSSEKKREAAPPAIRRVLPMDLKIGDRLVDETGEWEIVGRPYTAAGGKNARVRVQRVGEPAVTDLWARNGPESGHRDEMSLPKYDDFRQRQAGCLRSPGDRRVPQANRGACVPDAPPPRSPLP